VLGTDPLLAIHHPQLQLLPVDRLQSGAARRAFQDQRMLVFDHPVDPFALFDFQGLREGRRADQVVLAILAAPLDHLHRGVVANADLPFLCALRPTVSIS
jgi:hypothetical protein